MKKCILFMCIALLSIGALSASAFQLGPIVSYSQMSEDDDVEFFDDALNANNFMAGLDMRVNVWAFQIQADATFGVLRNYAYADLHKRFSSVFLFRPEVAVNLHINKAPFTLQTGIGIAADVARAGGAWYVDGDPMSEDPEALLSQARLFYRTGVGVGIGALELSVLYTVPVRGSFASFDPYPDLEDSRLSVSLLFGI